MNYFTIGIFENTGRINDVVSALRDAGATDEDLTLLTSSESAEVAEIIGAEPQSGAIGGALAGTSVGGALGALGAVALVAIPGVGTVLASGLIATLSGSVLGGYLGTLYGMRAETHETIELKNRITDESIILISQVADEEMAQAHTSIMQKYDSTFVETVANES